MEKVYIRLESGLNVVLSDTVHDEYFRYFDEVKYASFSHMLDSGLYFSQIVQFIMVMSSILNGHTSFKEIFLCNIYFGVGYTVIWYLCKMYKLPGVSFLCCLIERILFRFFLHFVVIAIVSLFVIGNWKIILYCAISGFVTQIVKTFLYAFLANVKYNDEVAIYVSKFKS